MDEETLGSGPLGPRGDEEEAPGALMFQRGYILERPSPSHPRALVNASPQDEAATDLVLTAEDVRDELERLKEPAARAVVVLGLVSEAEEVGEAKAASPADGASTSPQHR